MNKLQPDTQRRRAARTATGAAVATAALALALAAEPESPPATEVAFGSRQLTPLFYSEGATAADIDGDGHRDIVAGPFWYRGPGFDEKHEIYPPEEYDPKGYSHNFLTFTEDIDEDGKTDVVVFGFPGAEVFWYRNPGEPGGHWPKHLAVPVADNESPHFADIDGDGRSEIVCSLAGKFITASPGPDPTAPWEVTEISPEATGGKYTHGLGVGDVNGDGRLDLLDKDSWWEQPAPGAGAADGYWIRHRFAFAGPGGSQMYAYDFDGDGDNDILTSLHAHGFGLAWYEQRQQDDGSRTFVQHLITGERPEENRFGLAISQMHSIDLEDIDGDGTKDIVTGKRWWAHGGKDPGADMPAVLYWFKTVPSGSSGQADFFPYQIHSDSGVGTQVDALDIDGDGRPDIVVGNKKGTFVHLQK